MEISSLVNVPLNNKERKGALYGCYALMLADMFFSLCIAICLPTILVKLGYSHLYTIIVVIRSVESALGMLVGGSIGDIFGRKNLIKMLVPLLIISAFVCGLALDIITFFIGIFILGFVNGILIATGFTVVSDVTEPNERGQYFGYLTTVTNIAMVSTPIIAGILTDLKIAQFTFWVPLPFAIIGYLLLMKNFKNKVVSKDNQLDYVGFILITICISAFITILTIGGKQVEWLSVPIVALTIITIAIAIYLSIYLKKKENPIIDFSIFKFKSYSTGSLITALRMPYTTILTTYLILYVQTVLHQSATISGMISMPKTIATIFLPIVFGKILKEKYKGRMKPLIVQGTIVGLVAGILFIVGIQIEQAIWVIFVVSALYGLAESMQSVSLSPYSLMEMPKEYLGKANSMLTFIPAIASSFVTAIFGSIVALHSKGLSGAVPIMGYISIIAAAISCLLATKRINEDH